MNDTFTGISWVSDVRDNFVGSVVKCKGFNLVIGFSMIHARRADKQSVIDVIGPKLICTCLSSRNFRSLQDGLAKSVSRNLATV